MTEQSPPIAIRTEAPRRRPAAAGGWGAINDRLAWFLLALAALAPVPLAANRPFFWGTAALLVGMGGAVYFLALAATRQSLRIPLRLTAPTLAFALLVLFTVLQALPLPWPEALVRFPAAAGGVVVGAALSLDPVATAHTALRLLGYGLVFFLAMQVAVNRARAALMLEVLFAIVVAHAVYGLLALTQFGDTLLFFEKWAYEGMATGTFVNRNSFATFLAFGLVIGLGRLLAPARSADAPAGLDLVSTRQALRLLGLVIIAVALLATQSRMGAMAAAIGAIAVLCLSVVRLAASRRIALLVGLAGLVAAVVLLVTFGSGVLERLGTVESAFDVRAELYRQVLGMIAVRPWLGYGAGSFEIAYPLFHQLPVSPDAVWDKAHNTYLTAWVEYGIVAGSALIALVAWRLVAALGRWWRGGGDWPIQAALVGVIVVGAVHSLVDFSLEIEANLIFFAVVLGLGAAQGRTRSDRA